MSDYSLQLAQGLRKWEDENPWKSAALGFVPVVGTAMGFADAAAAMRDPEADWLDKTLSVASLIPGGKLLKGLRKAPVSELDVYHGSRGAIPKPDVKMGTGEGAITEGPGFYTTTNADEAAEYAAQDYGNPDRIVRAPVLNQYELPDEYLPYFHNKHARAPHQTSEEALDALVKYHQKALELPNFYSASLRQMSDVGSSKYHRAIGDKLSEEERALAYFTATGPLGLWKQPLNRLASTTSANLKLAEKQRELMLASGLRGVVSDTKRGMDKYNTHSGKDQAYYSVFNPRNTLIHKGSMHEPAYTQELVRLLRESGGFGKAGQGVLKASEDFNLDLDSPIAHLMEHSRNNPAVYPSSGLAPLSVEDLKNPIFKP